LSEPVVAPAVFNAEEARAYLRLPDRTFRRLLAEGRLPGFRCGRLWRFRREALERWIEAQEQRNQWRQDGR
jgi:excisionase family DNA binding protein